MRNDISEYLIHFTKDTEDGYAVDNLISMLRNESIKGGNGFTRRNSVCVCFSEAPLDAVREGFVNPDYYSKYSGFGIMLSKKYLFEFGGRPVIYDTTKELDKLPKDIQWRTVRYNPTLDDSVDFTWEREWRIHASELLFPPEEISIIVPTEADADYVYETYIEPQIERIEDWERERDNIIFSYEQIMSRTQASMYVPRRPHINFPYEIIVLEE